jgi:2-dehydro-3-deoxyphosphogluconate aldolase/(4S)-4-hydroxy-2-oxoglutarate aldolase
MVTSTELLTLVGTERLMPIIRSDDAAKAAAIGIALIDAGYGVLEVSLTTPNASQVIAELGAHGGAEIGAGTVLTVDDVKIAADAGATFIVTPAVAPSIGEGVAAGLPVLAGALTPTEILAALDAGATAVKLFPAELGGPSYFSALRAPLPHVPLIPVGGVSLESGRDFLDRGAIALGVGSPLTGKASDQLDLESLTARAAAFRRMALA